MKIEIIKKIVWYCFKYFMKSKISIVQYSIVILKLLVQSKILMSL